ncbi:unnamed protein product [Tuber melanosporum]|uniref:(Perigord truffle) hypothetical protein n=1 Tax=Tuber melanosporum (strain Mel28) TaxID=656061 RepID=D5G5D0_TUBMM|nr:uncharacterized protein GSTUM_00004274001 [Tuber melanosporum]CAZ79723.1 unnamed protein product [Tuber melanosporum]
MPDDINGFIALVAFITVLTIFGTIGRLCILRRRPRTLAVNISDAAFVLFTVLMVATAGIAYDVVLQELRIRRDFGDQAIPHMLFTEGYLKEFFAITLFCTTQVWLLKAAFLGYYWSLRETLTDRIKFLLYAVSAYCLVTYIGVLSFQFAYCHPISTNWSTGSDRCLATLTVPGMILQQWTNITSDIMVLIVPLFTISTLNLGRKDLYALSVVFCIGALSIAASVVRFTQVYYVVMHADNSIEAIRRTLVWAVIEKLFAFTAFCLPCLRVFYRKRHSGSGCLPAEKKTLFSTSSHSNSCRSGGGSGRSC